MIFSSAFPAAGVVKRQRRCGKTYIPEIPARSVAAVLGRGADLPRALVPAEVVPREDVVDPQAVGAGEPLADVALQQGLVVDEGVALPIDEQGLGDRLAAGLATARRFHRSLVTPEIDLRNPPRGPG